ncbi:UNVERIFIED_CONTAM: hypothetical protein K2H54_044856 [Gekko kuhli]
MSAMGLEVLLFILHSYFSRSASEVIQMPTLQRFREGDLFTSTCRFSTAYETFFWYRQQPGSAPTFLFSEGTSKDNVTKGRFTLESLENGKQQRLYLPRSQLHDAGVYLCAVEAQ